MCDECAWHHQNIPRASSVLTLGNKVTLYCIVLYCIVLTILLLSVFVCRDVVHSSAGAAVYRVDRVFPFGLLRPCGQLPAEQPRLQQNPGNPHGEFQ